ncbi:MAG: sialate O-acetylesterase [Opitutaceae bacterium]|jgi:sialate O-acetylesterase
MKPFFAVAVLLVLSSPVRADVTLPDIFSDHTVLQKSSRTAVWGEAAPGEKIAVRIGPSVPAATTAGADGRWRVTLDLRDCPTGPFDLKVRGDNEVTSKDVMVGEVWICSGQSNMEMKLSQTADAPAEIAASANPLLRVFQPKRQTPATPAETLHGRWVVSAPDTAGGFSAVGYYFAKTVQASVPGAVGLVDTSWGGTPAEAWISSAGLDTVSDLKVRKDAILAEQPQAAQSLRTFARDYADWSARYDRGGPPAADPALYAGPDVDVDDWKSVTLPGMLSAAGLPDSGAVWLRREVDIPANRAGTYLPLLLGELNDFDAIYWNGKKIGETTETASTSFNPDLAPTRNRRYDVPGDQMKAGRNTLAVRLLSPGGGAGIKAHAMTAGWNIPLGGEWRAKVEFEFPPLPAAAVAAYPHRPAWPVMGHYTATYLYNGLVHPLADLTLRGVLWYQGEANVGRAWQYRETFPLLVADWRRAFHRPDLPFYFCQLANFQAKNSDPAAGSAWAELREAQAGALALPGTGMAVLIDIGEEQDIHFRDKRDAGVRLAAVALAKTYGRPVPCDGPVYRSTMVEGGRLRLRFAPAEGGLVARPLPEVYQPKSSYAATKPLIRNSPDSELQGFAVCGDDHRWKWAQAKIDGGDVVVWSPEVLAPRYVRYAWADNPTCNLYNAAGFPPAPFRTDDFPATTAGRKF